MRVVTDIIAEEQYTPQGTSTVLRIEDVDIDELLKGKLAKLRPWDIYVAAMLICGYSPVEKVVKHANLLVSERSKIYQNDE